jgi:hypothetical protein
MKSLYALRGILALAFIVVFASGTRAGTGTDPLPSWNDGPDQGHRAPPSVERVK